MMISLINTSLGRGVVVHDGRSKRPIVLFHGGAPVMQLRAGVTYKNSKNYTTVIGAKLQFEIGGPYGKSV
jgi:hypothetical protein